MKRRALHERFSPALTRGGPPLWSRAMQKDDSASRGAGKTGRRPDEALKKAHGAAKGGGEDKEARLAAALRENLRRRKKAAQKETD